MNKQELNEALGFINNPKGELQIIIYANREDYDQPQKLNINVKDLPTIRTIFVESINSSIISKDEYTVLPLSIADERGKCFYQYDLEIPKELEVLEKTIGNDKLKEFNFKDQNLSIITSLIIIIADNDNEISLFKKLSNVEVIGRGGFIFKKTNNILERFEDQMLRITSKFQIIRVMNELIITDLNTIEKSFGFHEVITREASLSLNSINNMNLINNIDSLHELIGNVGFARKLTKVARNSPVIKHNIPNDKIIEFAKSHPLTKSKMRFNADETQFVLDTRISKDLFIKILNDDLLTSELTKLYYDSLAKDDINTEE